MSAVTEDIQKYEVLIIFNPDLPDGTVEDFFEKIKQHIKGISGEITLEKQLGRIMLAAPIKNHTWGVYYLLNFNLQPDKIHELHEHLRLDTDVIRYLLINVPMNYEPKINFEEVQEARIGRQKRMKYEEAQSEKEAVVEAPQKDTEATIELEEKSVDKKTQTSAEKEEPALGKQKDEASLSADDGLEEQIQRILDSKDLKSKI